MIRFLSWFVFLFVVWYGMTLSLHWQELALGAILSLGIAMVHVRLFPPVSKSAVGPLVALQFIPYFLKELVKANVDVAKLVLSPKIHIKPGIIALPMNVQGRHRQFLLANAITLTPGTLTLDHDDKTLWVHWVNIQEDDAVQAADAIKGGFEKILNK